MKKVVVACQKGGVSKTTLCVNLLVEAIKNGRHAAIIDTDPQGCAMLWASDRFQQHQQRPPVFTQPPTGGTGFDLLIYDTPPAADSDLPKSLLGADLMLLVSRTGRHDLVASGVTAKLAADRGIPVLSVITQVDPRSPACIKRAVDWMHARDIEIAGHISRLASYEYSLESGLGVSEFSPASHRAVRELQAIYKIIERKLS